MNRRNSRIAAGAAVLVGALTLAACSTHEVNTPVKQSSPPSTVATAHSTTPTTAAKGAAHVGATLSITAGPNKADVSLNQIINPATGALGPPMDDNGNPNGNSYVAALLTIKNTGSSAFSGDANSDASLIGSNNETYSASFESVNECTNFNSGEYQLGAGESSTGCVVFSVPAGVTPVKFKYSANGGLVGDFGEWLIP